MRNSHLEVQTNGNSNDKFKEYEKYIFDLAIEIETKDGYTAQHCHRIRDIAIMVGEQMNLSAERLKHLELAAFIHDVGKMKISDDILLKPDKLTDAEFEEMKKHTTFGSEIIREIGFQALEPVAQMVEQHHERLDGRGYPFALHSDQILLESQIISVVDSYDAMTSERVYNKGFIKTNEEAIKELNDCISTHYREDVVNAFVAIADRI